MGSWGWIRQELKQVLQQCNLGCSRVIWQWCFVVQYPSSVFIHCHKFSGKLIKTQVLVLSQDLAGSFFLVFVPFYLSQVISNPSIKTSFTLQSLSPPSSVSGKEEISVLRCLRRKSCQGIAYIYIAYSVFVSVIHCKFHRTLTAGCKSLAEREKPSWAEEKGGSGCQSCYQELGDKQTHHPA